MNLLRCRIFHDAWLRREYRPCMPILSPRSWFTGNKLTGMEGQYATEPLLLFVTHIASCNITYRNMTGLEKAYNGLNLVLITGINTRQALLSVNAGEWSIVAGCNSSGHRLRGAENLSSEAGEKDVHPGA